MMPSQKEKYQALAKQKVGTLPQDDCSLCRAVPVSCHVSYAVSTASYAHTVD